MLRFDSQNTATAVAQVTTAGVLAVERFAAVIWFSHAHQTRPQTSQYEQDGWSEMITLTGVQDQQDNPKLGKLKGRTLRIGYVRLGTGVLVESAIHRYPRLGAETHWRVFQAIRLCLDNRRKGFLPFSV